MTRPAIEAIGARRTQCGGIDLATESLFTLSELARQLPRRRHQGPTAPSTLYRWWRRGLRGVHLEVVQVGGSACSSREALARFFSRLAAQIEEAPKP